VTSDTVIRHFMRIFKVKKDFESSKLLMLSGVGPKKTLESHGIDLVVDFPNVGQNLIDHPTSSV